MSYSLQLQKAIYDILSGSNLNIYDRVPNGAPFPYVSFGPSNEYEDDYECIDAVRVDQQLDVWSRKPGYVEARTIAGNIRTLLHRQNVVLSDAALVEIEVSSIRTIRDPDGLTTHAIITITAHLEKGI